jgi:hypothetical protein
MTALLKEGALPLAAFRGSPRSIFAKMNSYLYFILAQNTPAGGARRPSAIPFAERIMT